MVIDRPSMPNLSNSLGPSPRRRTSAVQASAPIAPSVASPRVAERRPDLASAYAMETQRDGIPGDVDAEDVGRFAELLALGVIG